MAEWRMTCYRCGKQMSDEEFNKKDNGWQVELVFGDPNINEPLYLCPACDDMVYGKVEQKGVSK